MRNTGMPESWNNLKSTKSRKPIATKILTKTIPTRAGRITLLYAQMLLNSVEKVLRIRIE